MSKLFLTPINLNQNQLLNAAIQNLASAPSTPVVGQIYFDTVLNAVREWDGTAWTNKATDSLLLQGQNGAYYLSRANATGTQLASTISNLNATVIAYTLDTFAAPVASVSMNSQKITNLATPTLATDATTKAYVDATVQGLQQKPSAMVATAAALPANVYANGASGVGATLTASANGVLTVDGYVVLLNDVVLVKNEATTANNGLYTVTTLGTASVKYVLTRHVDMDQATEFAGAFIAAESNGTVTANTLWLCNVASSITVGTTAVTFTQLNAATSMSAGNGISIISNTVAAVVVASGGVLVGVSGLSIDTSIVPKKYAASIGDGATTAITVTHNLGTLDTTEAVYANSGGAEIECDVTHATTNTTTFTFATAPTSNQYRVVIHG